MHDTYFAHLPADLRPDPLPERRSTWLRWHGCEVHVERIGDPGAPRRLLMLHGGGGHAALLWPYAAVAAAAGFEVVVPDLPGYGRTRVPRSGAVRYPDWVGLACELAVAEADGRPLWIAGASMGGMLAYDVATRTGVADRVIVTCLLDPRDPDVQRAVGRAPWLGALAAPLLRVAAGPLAGLRVPIRLLTNMRAISNQPGLARIIAGDPLGGGNRVPLGFLRSFLESAPAVAPEAATGPEFVLAHPAADRWTPVELSLPFFTRLAAPKRLVLLDNGGHLPIETPAAQQLLRILTGED